MVELSAGASVALGVIVGLLSTSIQSVGLTLQRKSHLLEEEKEEDHKRRPPYRRRRWQLGMLMFLVANLVGSTIQITTLPLPVLSTLQASGLVFNSICATIVLGEPFTRYSLAGTILVAGGAVLIGTFGSISEPSHNLDQLLVLLGRREFLLWLFGTFAVTLGILFLTWFLKRLYPRPTPRLRLVRGMCFGSMSGILSAHSLLVAKSAVELLVRTISDRNNQFNRWQSWMILLGLVFLALTQLYCLHRGLKLCSTSVLYPFVFCIYNIIAILDGLIYFDQSSRLPVLHAGLIALGTAILLSGVLALSWRLDESSTGIDATSTTTITATGNAKIKHTKARVPTPQTALTPGMGLVKGHIESESDAEADDEDEALHQLLEDERIEREFDPERGFGRPRARIPAEPKDQDHRRRRSADEGTPLLNRMPTAPLPGVSGPASQKQKPQAGADVTSPRWNRSPKSPRPGRFPKRVTVAREANEIWDELNDRGDVRRTSGELVRSPRERRLSRSGTLPTCKKTGGGGRGRRSSWWGGYGGMAKGKRADEGEGDEQTDSSPPQDSPLLQRRGSRQHQGQLGEWFKLRWWKRKRRDGSGDPDDRDEGGERE